MVATNRETQHGQRYDNGQQQREHHHHHGHQRHGQYAQPAQCDVDKDVKEQAVGKRAALKAAIGREELPEEFFVENFVHVKAVVGGSGREWCFFYHPKCQRLQVIHCRMAWSLCWYSVKLLSDTI